MSNSRLLWPTPEQLRRRLDLMDRMMRKRGVEKSFTLVLVQEQVQEALPSSVCSFL